MQIDRVATGSSVNLSNNMVNTIGKESSKGEVNPGVKAETIIPIQNKKHSEENIIDAIEEANKHFIVYDRRFEFSIHDKTKQIMVKVIDVNTDEVIRELPSEKILDIVAAMWEVSGIIVDKKI